MQRRIDRDSAGPHLGHHHCGAVADGGVVDQSGVEWPDAHV
jgi:hypothetical protein